MASERSEPEVAADLVRRIRHGDEAAEAALVERYSRGLLYFLRHTTGDPALADDLHQETFRVVLERLRVRELDEPAKLASFLRITGRNLFIGEYRKTARRRTGAEEERLAAAVDPAPSPLRRVLVDEEAGLVHRMIGELASERDREIIYRFYVAEDDKERICADLALSSLHFNRVIFRARQRFKELLQRFPDLG